MLPVAFASSLWTATLRRIARTAVTALALIAGLTGPAAMPAGDHLHPAAAARPATELRVDAPVAVPVDVGPAVRPARAAASGIRSVADSPVRHPLAAPAPAGSPHRAGADAPAPVVGPGVVIVPEPGRAAIARRGPPRA
ncbi:hypothetical protein [Micromonospora sp. MA102]|uniref:hypothetical protein n=1 Tax=Micromonospora sp. MA102 TaxID=2952755 RepID=UPI0021C6C5A6|nr:hypothetical protein [Micromonospora sp. MA102]